MIYDSNGPDYKPVEESDTLSSATLAVLGSPMLGLLKV